MSDKKTPKPTKAEADRLVADGLSDQTIHQYHVGRKDNFWKAMEMYRALGMHDLGRRAHYDHNIFAFSHGNGLRRHYDKKWGRFGPTGTRTNADGTEDLFPDPRWIDNDMLVHAQQRLAEADNPLVLAIYNDLLFEHTKAGDKRPFAHAAIDNYIKSAPIQYKNNWAFECQDSLIRAWELAMKIADKARIAEVQALIFTYVDKYAAADNPRFSLELMEALITQNKRLTAEQLQKIANTALKSSTKYSDNHHLEQSFIEFAKKVYRLNGDTTSADKLELQIIDSLLAEAEFKKEQALVEAHFLEQALERIHRLKDPRKEADELRRRIEEAYERAIPQFKKVSVEIKVTNEEAQQIIDHYFLDDPVETLKKLSGASLLTPLYQQAEKLTEKMLRDHPISQIFGGGIIQGNRRIGQTKGGLDVTEDKIVTQMGQDIKFASLYRAIIFRELKRRSIGADTMANLLRTADFFAEYDNFAAIEEALNDYDDGRHFSAVCVLAPQIEDLLRAVVYKLGHSTTVTVNGSQQAIKIGEILELLRPGIGDEAYWYLKVALDDKRGMDLRNVVGHGLLKHGPQNEDQAQILIHLLLVLASFKFEQKSAPVTSKALPD